MKKNFISLLGLIIFNASLLISASAYSFAFNTSKKISVSIQGGNNLCPMCTHIYLSQKHGPNRDNPGPEAISVESSFYQVPENDGNFSSGGIIENKLESILRAASAQELTYLRGEGQNSGYQPAISRAVNFLWSPLKQNTIDIGFFYQVNKSKNFHAIYDEVAYSPYQVFSISYNSYNDQLEKRVPKVSLNIMQNYLTASLSLVHESYHLLDPLEIVFRKNDRIFDELESFILEYRAYLNEKNSYSFLKDVIVKRGMLYGDSPEYDILESANSDSLISFVFTKMYPSSREKIPLFLNINFEADSLEEAIVSEHSRNRNLKFVVQKNRSLSYIPTDKIKWNLELISEKDKSALIHILSKWGMYDPKKNLELQLQQLQSAIINQYLEANRLPINNIANLLGLESDSSLKKIIKALKKYIKENGFDNLTWLKELNRDYEYDGPKGANGGD